MATMKASSLIAVLLVVAAAALAAPASTGGSPLAYAAAAGWAAPAGGYDDAMDAPPAAEPSMLGMDLDAIPDGGVAPLWAPAVVRTDVEPSPGAEVPSPGPEVPSPGAEVPSPSPDY